MADPGLSPLQRQVLELLASVHPRWTLTGGGALAGFHLRHRSTRDLDLFWHGEARLGAPADECARLLEAAGLSVTRLQQEPAFRRLLVSDDRARVILDLVAEPVPFVEPPAPERVGRVSILVDTPHEILVNKLCSLLGRVEIRDLADLRELLLRGGDLARAISDAPRKDAGFSAVTLAWVLEGMDLKALAASIEWPESGREELKVFRDRLVEDLLRLCRPAE